MTQIIAFNKMEEPIEVDEALAKRVLRHLSRKNGDDILRGRAETLRRRLEMW